jgi:hypothetical protein
LPRLSRYITVTGLFEKGVLGIFSVIRGFADLKDLASISSPFEMMASTLPGQVEGHQRQIDLQHARNIKDYLENRDNRFIPEVILSVRTDTVPEMYGLDQVGITSAADDGIGIRRSFSSKNVRVHQIQIERDKLKGILEERRIRRIDGNHRLAVAPELQYDAAVPNKYLAPFCALILRPVGDVADDYAESLIFHTLNSKALLLESEHALKLILGQRPEFAMTAQMEFSYDASLHLTRLLHNWCNALPAPARERFGDRPLTSLSAAAKSIIVGDPSIAVDLATLKAFADALFAGLADILAQLWPVHPSLCRADYFIDLATHLWNEKKALEHDERVQSVVSYLLELGKWLGRDGLLQLRAGSSLGEQLLNIHRAVIHRIPKRVFLARWYPNDTDGAHLTRANLRLGQIQETLQKLEEQKQIKLSLEDIGTREGGTFPIHQKMYEAIASSDIVLVDLTGVRPNVCVEAGFALSHHQKNRLIFLYQKGNALPDVPFDLKTFRYEQIEEAAEIPNKLRGHIEDIFRETGLLKE